MKSHSTSHNTFARSAISRAALLSISALAGALVSLPSFAQGTATPQADDTQQLDKVVVTGTMIPRTTKETAEALTVISADSLKEMGVTTIEQALQQIASNQSGILTASSVSSWGTGGGSFANLRGLGASKTLVLLDGQRLANNVVLGSAVDLNGIPFAAIDHIEVLREGASSVYGADAIAGVINFITKKDYEGGEFNIGGASPKRAGGSTANTDITYGKGNLASDGYNILFSANYTQTKELTASQRSFAATGLNVAGGLNNQNGPMGTFPGSYQDANGNIFQVGYPTCTGNTQLSKLAGNCAFLYSAVVDLIPPSSELSGMVSLTKALPNDNTLNVQYFYTRSKVRSWAGPQTYSFPMNSTEDTTYYPTAANSTPFGGGTATPDLTDPITVGWTDPNNNRYNVDVNTEQRFLIGLTGDAGGWHYATNFNYSVNQNTLSVDGGYADYALLTNPDGSLSNLINPFGAQSAQGQALINSAYMNGPLASGGLSLMDLSAQASHELGDYFHAGRPFTLAFGVDAREERIGFNPTALAATLYTATYYPPAIVHGNRNEEAIYGELNMPVTKDLEFTLSDREDRYSDFGSTNNAKLSFRYQPLKELTFRGAASTGFRAPSLVDLFAPQTLGAASGSMIGPGCPAGNSQQYGQIFTAANCAAQGMALYGGNPQLHPEKSNNYDLGIVVEPVRNLGVTLDFYKVTVSNEIQAIPDNAIYANPGQFMSEYVLNSSHSLTQAPVANTACPTLTAPTCGYILLNTQNTGGISTSGVDFSTNYLLKTSVGRFRFGLEGTWVTSYRLQEYQGAQWLSLRGQFNQGNEPVNTWQHLLTLDWNKGDWGAGLTNNYTSSYVDQYADGNGNVRRVGAYSIWGIHGSYKPTQSVSVLVGVRNLFDTNPPFSNQTNNWQAGFNPLTADPTGRAYYAKVTYDF